MKLEEFEVFAETDTGEQDINTQLPAHLYWNFNRFRLECRLCHPAHTVPQNSKNFFSDPNVKNFTEEHKHE